MRIFKSGELYPLLYAGNQFVAVLAIALAIRYGKDIFGLKWTLGAILTLGWGVTVYSLMAPTLALRVWSAPLVEGVKWSFLALLRSEILLAIIVVVSFQKLELFSGISWGWIVIFVSIGVIRGFAQTLSTYSIRLAEHNRVLGYQLTGRVIEIGLVVYACLTSSYVIFVLAWLSYPLWQLSLFVKEMPDFFKLSNSLTTNPKNSLALVSVNQVCDLIMPTLWLHIGGSLIFVAYRAMNAALSNSAMLPRYWFAVFTPTSRAFGGKKLLVISFVSTVCMFAGFLWITKAVNYDLLLWSFVSLTVNSLSVPYFSSMRQHCLNLGQISYPSLAIIIGRLFEALLLLFLSQFNMLPSGVLLLAFSGFALSLPALHFFVRRIL